MTKQGAIEKSIAHWDRMIAWVKTQPATERMSILVMLKAINETWSGSFCYLCNYSKTLNDEREVDCEKCGLNCNSYNPLSPWREVDFSGTWGEWLLAAENMIKAIKELK